MNQTSLGVLHAFRDMETTQLDLHALFEAAGNDPADREKVLDGVNELLRSGLLERPYRDQTFINGKDDRIAQNQARKPGEPSPFIDRGTYIRYYMISIECIEAQEAWVRAGKITVHPPSIGQ